MKRAGFRPHLAAAIEACASTGGQITPPVMGIAAFIMAEFLQVPFYEVALAAVVPALLFYVALFIQVDLEAARSGILPMPKEDIPRLGGVLREGWYFLLPLAALVYALFGLNYEPEMAGLVATAIVLALGVVFPFRGKRIGFRDLYAMLRDAGTSVLDLFMLGAAAGIMIGALNYSGVGFTLTLVLILLAGGSLFALLVLSAIANIILGLGLPTVGVYIVLATLVAPALVKMGIAPMAAHMFIMYYGCLSMISPPVAIAAFVAANLAGADPNRTGWTAMAFGWTLFVIPFLFVFSGTLLLPRGRGGLVHFRRDDGLRHAPPRSGRPRLLRSHGPVSVHAGERLRRRALDQRGGNGAGRRDVRPGESRPPARRRRRGGPAGIESCIRLRGSRSSAWSSGGRT